MSGDWNTKYGTRRVRHDPPTLEEAIFAAIGITDDVEAQAEIASSLMGLPYDEVLAEVKKTARVSARTGTATRVIAGEQGAQRSVVVERRVIRFEVEAFEGTRKLGEGRHARGLINVERFNKRLAGTSAQ